MKITTRQHVSMLSEEVAEQLRRFHWHWSFVVARCLMKNDDHGPGGISPPIVPYAPLQRTRVFTGTRDTGSYNHHSQIARFQGRLLPRRGHPRGLRAPHSDLQRGRRELRPRRNRVRLPALASHDLRPTHGPSHPDEEYCPCQSTKAAEWHGGTS